MEWGLGAKYIDLRPFAFCLKTKKGRPNHRRKGIGAARGEMLRPGPLTRINLKATIQKFGRSACL